ncbi:structure-specific endonuclease subunit SLX4 [Paramisgurnus dabryanus]|uniref:structure-specific endonuclease subunit SLX4 n=1 Tax=Paramisgurnus dabryanus TaxID=90735 RepID=UPI0031F46078
MDDSDQDFTDLCSRLLKRVRRKGAGDEKKPASRDEEASSSSPCKNPPKRRKKTIKGIKTEIKRNTTQVGDVSQPAIVVPGTVKAKDAVLQRMQQFKRASPERLLHVDTNQPITTEPDGNLQHTDDVSSDEALALQLQQELDRESQADEDGGLFFCQLCQKDLTAMSPQLRTQHINRCLDAVEVSAPSASHHSHPRPHVPACPICGKCFKSEKSRSVHLKRCSSDLGVSPNDLLQALRRQATETVSDGTTDHSRQDCVTKRKNGVPTKKKSKRKGQQIDEDTMVAMALSRSLLEQERETQREMDEEREIQAQLSSPPPKVPPLLQWRPAAGKGRGKRRKGAFPAQPPLLLIQDPQTALNRLQERVSSLLLSSRPPSPPTPTLSPSALPVSSHAPLWVKSTLHGGGPDSSLEFYTSELSNFITPLIAPEREKLKSVEVTPVKEPPSSSSETIQKKCTGQSPAQHRSAPSPLTTCSGTPGTQALQDLMELAEEGMTLTQYGYTVHTVADKDDAANELTSSGFVPEKKHIKTTSVSVSKLASDLSSMVNNPQLSDVQLQVDSGDVFFTHSFMLYTRCPLLANMVHDSGFGVQEEGMPAAQRVLLGDVPGVAVLALLQYLYTAHCPLTYTLLPHVQQLSNRFCLPELQQQCEDYSGRSEEDSRESDGMFSAQEPHLKDQEDQNLAESNFLELLQSMWQHEDSEGEDEFKENSRGVQEEAVGELKDDRVDEEELEEIYEFAATQKKMETVTETEDDEADANKSIGNEKNKTLCEKSVTSLHSNEQDVDGTEAAIVTSPAKIHQIPNPNTGTPEVSLLSESNALGNTNLDKSYDRLFSQSVGEYTEPTKTPTSLPQQHYKSSHALQPNTPLFRPSCVSEVIDLSISPPPSSDVSGVSTFPVPGVSPVPDYCEDGGQPGNKNTEKNSESHSKQVELIVLSDSDEEMDVDHIAAIIKPEEDGVTPQSPTRSLSESKSKGTQNTSASQGHTGTEADQSEHPDVTNESAFDGSAEVSWLIPATPVQVRSSSSQTCVSMRRTQLFPKSCSSSSSSSSAIDRSKHSAHLSSSSIPEPKQDQSPALGYQTPLHNLKRSQITSKLPSDGSHTGIIIGSCVPQPSSSTPLHLDSSLQRHIPFGSPMDCKVNHMDNSNFSLGQVKEGLLSLQLSHSESSPSPSKTPEKKQNLGASSDSPSYDPDKSRENRYEELKTMEVTSSPSETSEKKQNIGASSDSSSYDPDKSRENRDKEFKTMEVISSPSTTPEKKQNIGGSLDSPSYDPNRSRKNRDEELKTTEVIDKDQNQDVVGVLGVAQASFCNLDEPPIAFDDSWGLDGVLESQKPCFSLKLDSSDGTASPLSTNHMASPPITPPLATGAHTETPEPSPAGQFNHSLPDPDMWDDWEENEEPPLPLSQRLAPPSAKRVAELKTPVACRNKNKGPLVPITPMPGYSDMDTPELKNKLNRFGVRPLPKKQMVLKLKEIHQYTHQLQSSESEEEMSPLRHLPCTSKSVQLFKQPTAPPAASPVKLQPNDVDDHLSSSQNSTTSSNADSDRSNPELCVSEDDDSDTEGITASQAVVREKDKILAVRQFIMSDPKLYKRVLQYQPLPLGELRASLKAAGIRLGAAKLLDFLDSQCITFSTAKQGQSTSSRRKQRRKAATNGPAGTAGRGRKKTAKPHGVG